MFASAKIVTAISVAFFGTSTLASLNKTPLFQNGLNPIINQGLWDHLAPTHSNWDQWGGGWIPRRCYEEANNGGLSPWDFEVFNVHYDDCGSAWTFCRVSTRSISLTTQVTPNKYNSIIAPPFRKQTTTHWLLSRILIQTGKST
jgi:hypothetical protein